MKLRKANRAIHRDLGYFFAGMVLIYSISGIALNHIHHWNPNYIITQTEFRVEMPADTSQINAEFLSKLLNEQGDGRLLSYYYPKADRLKAFYKNGYVTIYLDEGRAEFEKIRRRQFFSQINFLHYNSPRKWWTAFSDIFAASLIVITITGLFIVRGKNGITRRGAILVFTGLIFPLLALFLFFG